MPLVLAVDVHQHVWPEEVLLELERRTEPPRARRSGGAWLVEPDGEPAFAVGEDSHGVMTRAEAVRAIGLDRALVALSSPVGIEGLPAGEAAALLAAWDQAPLPEELERWAAVSLREPDPGALAAALDSGAVGACLPAEALATPEGIERLGGVLDVLESRLAPLFVHPGAAPARAVPAPAWWSPVVDYVSGLHAAWHAFAAWGRPAHRRLRVVFAALAGLAPLHAERSAARGGPVAATPDPLVFYDTSSYGARALRAMAATVGTAQLVHGTDAPVVPVPHARPLGHDVHDAMQTANVARLLARAWEPDPTDLEEIRS